MGDGWEEVRQILCGQYRHYTYCQAVHKQFYIHTQIPAGQAETLLCDQPLVVWKLYDWGDEGADDLYSCLLVFATKIKVVEFNCLNILKGGIKYFIKS